MLKTNSKVKEIDCHQKLMKDTALGIILWEKTFFYVEGINEIQWIFS